MIYNSFDIETLENNGKLIPYCVTAVTDNDKNYFFGTSCIDEFVDYLEIISIKKKKIKKKNFTHSHTT